MTQARQGCSLGDAAYAPVPPGEPPLCQPAEQQGRQMGGGSGYPAAASTPGPGSESPW